MDDKLFPDTSSYYKKTQKRPKGILAIVFLLILLLTGIFLGIRYFGGETGANIQGIVPVSPSPTEASAPTSEPTSEEDAAPTLSPRTTTSPSPTGGAATAGRETLSVAVQNGSGVAGAASSMARALRELGYNVVSTGNAETYDYEDVTIQVKPTKKSMLETLRKDLSKDYTIDEATADLSGSTADAVVIVGK